MLYHLLYPLSDSISFFNIFKYITFRTAYATVTALLVSFVLGPWIIKKLKANQVAAKIRTDGPTTHMVKEGTPTMGGLIILSSVVGPTALWADLTNPYIQIILLSTIWLGILGFMDDYMKVVKKKSKGLVGRQKLIGQVLLGLILGYILFAYRIAKNFDTSTDIPFLKNYYLEFGILYIPRSEE